MWPEWNSMQVWPKCIKKQCKHNSWKQSRVSNSSFERTMVCFASTHRPDQLYTLYTIQWSPLEFSAVKEDYRHCQDKPSQRLKITRFEATYSAENLFDHHNSMQWNEQEKERENLFRARRGRRNARNMKTWTIRDSPCQLCDMSFEHCGSEPLLVYFLYGSLKHLCFGLSSSLSYRRLWIISRTAPDMPLKSAAHW